MSPDAHSLGTGATPARLLTAAVLSPFTDAHAGACGLLTPSRARSPRVPRRLSLALPGPSQGPTTCESRCMGTDASSGGGPAGRGSRRAGPGARPRAAPHAAWTLHPKVPTPQTTAHFPACTWRSPCTEGPDARLAGSMHGKESGVRDISAPTESPRVGCRALAPQAWQQDRSSGWAGKSPTWEWEPAGAWQAGRQEDAGKSWGEAPQGVWYQTVSPRATGLKCPSEAQALPPAAPRAGTVSVAAGGRRLPPAAVSP